jgi:murein DD-endopeptidase MepM/ murein hydrolase activator NlpD
VFIDHGQGLITMYLHMSRLDVAVGDTLEQGQVIGAVGSSGRATGPHLCWRMKWRDRQLDPSVAIEGLAAARAQLLAAN